MNLDLARWQFAVTTVYHFLFVPLTLGTVWFVVGFQTAWVRTGNVKYLRLTKFFGKLFLINFAMGVVTGIVQEFQFGMNWSDYSKFVGDVFGAPLAMEGLLAFFLESTFLGLWIFGWDRLPKKLHLATIWAAAFGTLFSAFFILAANSWMQHPTGYEISETTGRAVLNDIGAVLFQNTSILAFTHTISASFLVAGAFVAAVGAWHMSKDRHLDVFRPAVKAGTWVILIAAVVVSITGDLDSKVMVEQQPMKMAAAEGLYETTANAPFSILSVGDLAGDSATRIIEVPGLLSFLATGSFDGTVQGINDLQAQYVQQYGPGDYSPYVPVTYWGFRMMIGLGMLAALYALWTLWRFRGGRNPKSTVFAAATAVITFLPLFGISAGWIFTEMGRQPWIVFGLQKTADGVSPTVGTASVLISFIGFTLVYAVLAFFEVRLMLKAIKAGPPEIASEDPFEDSQDDADKQLYFAY
ncbi:MAG: cytochrome ubiquinol oxidase subunit I [Candidatus Nanopelagicales bacterium]|nr:cytochrome ubiquinol oxidase subunit I [Candidatus Nanopelagicales bacterium]